VEAQAVIRQPLSGELGGLLDELQGRDSEGDAPVVGAGLELASAALPPVAEPEPEPEPVDEDDPSLEGLVNLARKEIGHSPQEQQQAPTEDILDDVLGDLPPPPPRPSGALPGMPPVQPMQAAQEPTEKKKKGGFFSRLFGRD
jgi:hypothetical protein